MAVSEKAVLRVSDLLDWLADPAEVSWDRGLLGVYEQDCVRDADDAQFDQGLNQKFAPGHSEFLADVRQEKIAVGKWGFHDVINFQNASNTHKTRHLTVDRSIDRSM